MTPLILVPHTQAPELSKESRKYAKMIYDREDNTVIQNNLLGFSVQFWLIQDSSKRYFFSSINLWTNRVMYSHRCSPELWSHLRLDTAKTETQTNISSFYKQRLGAGNEVNPAHPSKPHLTPPPNAAATTTTTLVKRTASNIHSQHSAALENSSRFKCWSVMKVNRKTWASHSLSA